MSATLRDLGPADKQKVAHLIQQVVDKERTIRELEAAAAAAADESAAAAVGQGQGQGQGGCKADQLADQNLELARENTSLRAKLSHAFDLLRTYQHKCRVLDATVQITGSRPATPRSGLLLPPQADSVAGGGVDPRQLAGRLGLLNSSGGGLPCTPLSSTCALEGHPRADAQGASGSSFGGSGQLSPVAEGAWEGPAAAGWPASSAIQAPQPASPSDDGMQQSQLHQQHQQQQQQALPQLETLKLLAQALLEAQAEVAAKQRAQAATAAAVPRLPSGQGALLYDASLGRHGGFLISPHPASSECNSSSRASSRSCRPSCGSELAGVVPATVEGGTMQAAPWQGCSGAPPAGQAAGRAPLSDLQHHYRHRPEQHQQHQQQLQPSFDSGDCRAVFDLSLSDLVKDVENMMQPQQQQQISSAALELRGCDGGGSRWGRGGVSACGPSALYEENDLLDLIAQL